MSERNLTEHVCNGFTAQLDSLPPTPTEGLRGGSSWVIVRQDWLFPGGVRFLVPTEPCRRKWDEGGDSSGKRRFRSRSQRSADTTFAMIVSLGVHGRRIGFSFRNDAYQGLPAFDRLWWQNRIYFQLIYKTYGC